MKGRSEPSTLPTTSKQGIGKATWKRSFLNLSTIPKRRSLTQEPPHPHLKNENFKRPLVAALETGSFRLKQRVCLDPVQYRPPLFYKCRGFQLFHGETGTLSKVRPLFDDWSDFQLRALSSDQQSEQIHWRY